MVLSKFDTKGKADGTGSGRVTKLLTAMPEITFGNSCQNNSKFIATDAVDIFTAKAVAEDFCSITDVLVTGKMAFGIIHPLQAIEIAHNDTDRLGSIKIIVISPGKCGAVFAAGELVVNGILLQFMGVVTKPDHHGNDKFHHVYQNGDIIHIFDGWVVDPVKADVFFIDFNRSGDESLDSLRF